MTYSERELEFTFAKNTERRLTDVARRAWMLSVKVDNSRTMARMTYRRTRRTHQVELRLISCLHVRLTAALLYDLKFAFVALNWRYKRMTFMFPFPSHSHRIIPIPIPTLHSHSHFCPSPLFPFPPIPISIFGSDYI